MNGIWNAESAKHHQSSLKFAQWLASYLPKDRWVIDFGCGNGYYMGYLENKGFDTFGIDGNKEVDILCTNFKQVDLTNKIKVNPKGTVISFETMEHIPKEKEKQAFENLINNSSGIILMSWASVGQPGIGHINCQNEDYVVSLFEKYGYELQSKDTTSGRSNVDKNCDWFERNLLVFKKI